MTTVAPASAGDFQQFYDRIVGRRVAEATANQYVTWAQRFESWRPGREPDVGTLIDFDALLYDDAAEYPWDIKRGPRVVDGYAHSTRETALSAVKLWCRLHHGVEIIEQPQNIVQGDPEPFEPEYLSEADIRRAIAAADGACDGEGCRAALALTYDCILRGSELVQLTRDDVDLQAGTVDVTATKGSIDSTLQMNEIGDSVGPLRSFLRTVERSPGEPLFRNAYGREYTANAWTTHFVRHHHEVGAHSFGRHSPILHGLESPEFDFGDIYRRSRHVSPSQTAKYARMVGVDIPDWSGT